MRAIFSLTTQKSAALLATLFVFSLVIIARAGEQWLTLQGGRYLPNPANDGDSFHVRATGREYIFRLYFVDTPETDLSVPERVAEQARYFHVTVPEALEIGQEAERFTRTKLSHPFTIQTCKEDARGRSRLPRYFAFVRMGSADLAEELVSNGLARVYGAAGQAPDLNAPEAEWRKLRELERKAKAQKVGGWGVRAGRLNTRAAAEPEREAASFDAFFHRDKSEIAAPASAAKLDVNRASLAALQKIPGVGAVLASRIIAARPFQSADELQRVKGIGPKKYEQLRPYFE